jgi:dipeptidyl aminopeptidase/acylaminoacyl peptidase
MSKLLASVSLLLITFITSAQVTIPTKAFVQLPDVENVQLSPSGNKLAMLKRVISNGKRVFVVEVTDLNTGKKSYPVVRRKHEFDVYQMIWASDNHILLKIDFFKQLKIENTGFNPKISERRLMVLNLRDNSLKNILNGQTMKRFRDRGWQPQFQDNIIDILPNEPDHILHAMDWDARQTPQVFKVNLNTLERSTVLLGKENWSNIKTDRQGNVRASIYKEIESGGLVATKVTYELNVRAYDSKRWSVLARFEQNSPSAVWPLGFLDDPNMLLVEAKNEGRDAIFKIDLRNPSERTLFYSSSKNDVGGTLFYSNKTNNPVGYSTTSGVKFWDDSYEAFSQSINKALPNTNNFLRTFDVEENKYLVYSKSDIDSGTYYLGDKQAKSLNPIAFVYQGLDPSNLAQTERHSMQTQDQKKRKLFVTLPKNHDGTPLPTIIYANEGRGNASVGGFDYKTQLWANRGYAVIQVNFRRPEEGYYGFMQGDVAQWAPALYNDIIDAHKWAVSEGIANSKNVCLFGQHYAGYIALMAGAKSPGTFKCIATVAALTDINNYLFNNKGFTSYEQKIANWSPKASMQTEYSPISYVNRIKVPIFIAHGEDDGNVRVSQSQLMNSALLDNKVPVTYIEIPNEDSSFSTDASRMKVFGEMESFFKKHLNN